MSLKRVLLGVLFFESNTWRWQVWCNIPVHPIGSLHGRAFYGIFHVKCRACSEVGQGANDSEFMKGIERCRGHGVFGVGCGDFPIDGV